MRRMKTTLLQRQAAVESAEDPLVAASGATGEPAAVPAVNTAAPATPAVGSPEVTPAAAAMPAVPMAPAAAVPAPASSPAPAPAPAPAANTPAAAVPPAEAPGVTGTTPTETPPSSVSGEITPTPGTSTGVEAGGPAPAPAPTPAPAPSPSPAPAPAPAPAAAEAPAPTPAASGEDLSTIVGMPGKGEPVGQASTQPAQTYPGPSAILEELSALDEDPVQVENEVLDLVDMDADQDAMDGKVDQAAVAIGALESLRVLVNHTKLTGGMSIESSRVFAVSIASIYDQVGLGDKVIDKQVSSLESITEASRMAVTEATLESITQGISQIAGSIAGALKAAYQWTINFFAKVFNTAGLLEKRANNVASAASKVSGEPRAKTIASERLVEALAIGNSVPTSLKSAVSQFVKTTEGVYDTKTPQGIDHFASDWGKLIKFRSLEELHAAVKVGYNKAAFSQKASPSEFKFREGKDFECVSSPELFGNKKVAAYVPKSSMSGGDIIHSLHLVRFGVFSVKTSATKLDLKTLTPAEAGDIAREVISVARSIKEFNKHVQGLSRYIQTVNPIDGWIHQVGESPFASQERQKLFQQTQWIINECGRLLSQPGRSYAVYALRTGKALLDYAEKSIKQYS